MKTTLDRKTKDILRNLERSENLQARQNVTPEQDAWETAFQMLKGCLSPGSEAPDYAVIAFKVSHMAGKRLKQLTCDQPIVRKDQVTVVSLSPIDSRHWKRSKGPRRWRLNWLEHRVRRQSDGLRLIVSTHDDVDDYRRRARQRDAFKQPIQDHPQFALNEYDPFHLIPMETLTESGEPTLDAPFDGQFEVQRDERHVNLLIDGLPVFRLLHRDAEKLQTHADDSEKLAATGPVKKGAPLARMQDKTYYGQLRYYTRGGRPTPDMDVISGDVFSATLHSGSGNIVDLKLCVAMMSRMGHTITDDAEAVDPLPISQWAPRHLAEFDAEKLGLIVQHDDWVYTQSFRDRLVKELGPGGTLFVRANVKEPTAVIECHHDENGRRLVYATGEIQHLTQDIVLLESFDVSKLEQGGFPEVTPEMPIGNYFPRTVQNWSWYRDQATIDHVAAAYFTEFCIRPGALAYDGNGVLIDASLIPDELRSQGMGEDYLDLRPCQDYLTADGTIVCPPIKLTNWAHFDFEAGGIAYNTKPKGDKLSANPVVQQGR